ncbi:MAG: CDP-alcohol phosphatidyltransferase family protein [Thermoanaerobaculia bacterium]
MTPSPHEESPFHGALTIPNGLTLLRILLIPVFVAATLAQAFTAAFVTFVLAGFTDAFDGYIARRLNQRSRLGAILDPAADKVMMFSGYVLYTFSPAVRYTVPVWLTFTIFIRDAVIISFAYLLYTRINIRRFPPSIAGKFSTVLQVVTISGAVAANMFLAPIALLLLPVLFQLCLLATLYSSFDYLRRGESMLYQQVTALNSGHKTRPVEENRMVEEAAV